MTDDEQHVGIGNHVSRIGNADFRFGLVVLRHQLQIVAEIFECLGCLFHRQLRAELDMLA